MPSGQLLDQHIDQSSVQLESLSKVSLLFLDSLNSRTDRTGDPTRHLAMVQAVRQTFISPTLTPPKPSIPRAAEPTSCSSAPTPPPPVEETPVEEKVSEAELEKRIGEWKEIALFLRRNVVQGEQGEDGSFRMSPFLLLDYLQVVKGFELMIGLRVTEDTELGDNLTIKEPPILPTTPFPNRNKRRRRTPAPTEPSS
jgi:complex III assembly factor LYRM7